MLSDEFLEKVFAHPEARACPLGTQSSMLHAVEDVVEEMWKENNYATLSELLTNISVSTKSIQS